MGYRCLLNRDVLYHRLSKVVDPPDPRVTQNLTKVRSTKSCNHRSKLNYGRPPYEPKWSQMSPREAMESSTSSGGGIQIKNSYLRREVHDPLIPRPGPDHPRALAQGWLTLISAGVILRLVGLCLTVAARESASAMSGLSVGSAATARISSNFSAQPERCHLSPRAATPTHASLIALTGANEPCPPTA